MTEVLPKKDQPDFDPQRDYDAENYPPVDVQAQFFRVALLESEDQRVETKFRMGPFSDEFTRLMEQLNHKVRVVDADFTPEYIMPYSYQSQWVQSRIDRLGMVDKRALMDIIKWRTDQIELLCDEAIRPTLRGQVIPDGTLDTPQFASQDEDWKGEASRGCTNACFRMVFGGITGWTPSQAAVSEQFKQRFGTVATDDEAYFKLYQTDAFQEICDKTVVTLSLIGADFTTIERITAKMKQKRPDALIYCTVNLSSQTAGNAVWHAAVLLGVKDDIVTYHDPVDKNGASKTCTTDQFAKRWAFAYNRAVLTIAV